MWVTSCLFTTTIQHDNDDVDTVGKHEINIQAEEAIEETRTPIYTTETFSDQSNKRQADVIPQTSYDQHVLPVDTELFIKW